MNNLQKTLVYDLEIAKAEDANNGYIQSINNVTSALKALLGAENNIVFGCNVTANGFKLTVGTGLVSSGDWIVVNPSEQNITVEAGQRIDILQATMVEEEFDEQSRTFINAIIGNKENKNVNTKLRQTLKIELKQGQSVVKAPAVDSGYIKLAELLVSNTGVTVYDVTAKSKTSSNANWTTDENSVYSLDSITENKVVDLLEQYKKALDSDIATLKINKADKSDTVAKNDLLNLVYPIGSLYWSSKATNPSELFGGTWTQIKDKFVLACGDTYKAEATGGSASVTLSVDNMPSHTHSFNCSGTTSGMSAHSTGSFKTLNFSDSPRAGAVTAVDGSTFTDDSSTNASHSTYWANSGRSMAGSTSYYGHHTIGLNVSHTHTLTVKGTTGTSGSGTAVSIMPPYVAKYCFERIA